MTFVGIAFSFLPDWNVVEDETRGDDDDEPGLDAREPRDLCDRWDRGFPGSCWGSCWSTMVAWCYGGG